ncbi:MAG: tRNA (adenosine(37)-N6)-threonylcarbamoyltransferase complex dimerization subunit type 1 TsaB [Phycisphaerae bacterium]|jgi:tRNA threonylcarbamoyladenosine biosynthesis protein TsaB
MKNKDSKPLIIAVETSGRHGSVALATGEELLAQKDFSQQMRHSSELLPAIEKLLERFGKKSSQIQHVYLSIGPGSFTGLRIAVTFAKTLAMADSVKIVTVNTSDVIFANVQEHSSELKCDRFATILDAKRGQYFIAAFTRFDSGCKKILSDCMMNAEQIVEGFADTKRSTALLGEGLVYHADKFKTNGIIITDQKYWWPAAANVHRLGWEKAIKGEFTNAAELQPLYLRQPEFGISPMQK